MTSLTRDQRLKQWYDDARIGLFIHWGMMTGDHVHYPFGPDVKYPYETVKAFEKAVRNAGWNADRWVETAKRIKAKYITIAAFHCALGYLKIWPSSVPGSPHTKKDYLQELIDAADAEGIQVIVYLNREPKNWTHGGVVWLNKQAYQAYKNNDGIDITSKEGFLDYSLDVIDELIVSHPTIAGFWFDGYHDKEEAQRVFARIHAQSPYSIMINNNFSNAPVEDEDAMSLEDYGKICSPDYDFASGTWVGPGKKEFAFKTKWDWFYLGGGRPEWKEDYELNYANVPDNATIVKRIVTIIGSSWNAHLGYGPRIGGDFPELLDDFTDHFNQFMSWAEESIYGTVGGGYDQAGFPPGYWNDGAYGVTTLNPSGNKHYLHILTPPDNQVLEVADAGYQVIAAEDLKRGELLSFVQSEGLLRIDVPSWETCTFDGDQVIRLITDGSSRVIPAERIEVTATSEDPAYPVENLLSRDYGAFYDAGQTTELPQSITFRFINPIKAEGLNITQPETGAVTSGGYAALDSERVKECKVYLSTDGENWGEPVYSGALRNQRGLQVIRFKPQSASHVRLEVISNYKATNALRLIYTDVIGV